MKWKELLYLILFSLIISCSPKSNQSDDGQDDLYQSAYDDENLYTIYHDGIGSLKLGSSIDVLEEIYPIAALDTIDFDGDEYSGNFLIRLAEQDEYSLNVQVVNNDIYFITVLTSAFSTENGISPQASTLNDLSKAYTIDELWVPSAGTVLVGVKGIPRLSFVFEDESLLRFEEGATILESDLPGTLIISKIYIAPQLNMD